MPQYNWRLGLSMALVTTLMWALLPIALKGLLSDISPTTATWYRFLGAMIVAGGYYGWKNRLDLKSLFTGGIASMTVLGVIGLLGNYLAYAKGLQFITPGAVQVLIQLAPLLLLVASVVWLGEQFSPRQWAGVAMVVVGLLLFFNQRLPELLSGADPQYLLGVGLTILAAVGWAVYGFYQKKILMHASPQDLLVLIYIVGTIVFLPGAEPMSVKGLDSLGWVLLAFVTLNTLIAYGAFTKALACWEASRVSATLALVPLLTLLISSLIGAIWPDYIAVEPLNWISWLGAIIVVCGSLFAAIGRSR